jgi:hypothetical protein
MVYPLDAEHKAAAKAFVDALVEAGKGQDDKRGLLLMHVASLLRAQTQHFTASLFEHIGERYGYMPGRDPSRYY